MALIFITYNKDDLGINLTLLTYLYRMQKIQVISCYFWRNLYARLRKSPSNLPLYSDINVDIAKWYLIFHAQTDLSDYSRYLLLICNKSVCYLDPSLTVQNVDQNIMYKFTNFIKYPCSRIHMWGNQDT